MQENSLWWQDVPDAEGERWRYMLPHVLGLEEAQYEMRQRDLQHGQAYDERCELMGTEMVLGGAIADIAPPIENVIASGVDTMTAHLTRDRPRLAVLTDGADYELQEDAKAVEKVLAAEVKRLQVYAHRSRTCRDAGVWGVGYVKIYEPHGEKRPAIDRVLKDEIVIDEEEARYYAPRSMFHRRFYDRWQLLHMFARGKREQEIRKAILEANADGRYCSYRRLGKHQVAVIEGWHLPSGPGAGDGRRTISIKGCDLVDEGWDKPYFPILEFFWSERLTGYGGRGIAEQGLPIQNRVNRHDRFIAVAQDRVAIPRVYFQRGSGVDVQLDNRVGAKVSYTGRPPIFETPQAVNSEIYNDRREKKNTFYEALGISQLMARAQRPAGVDTAPSMREYHERSTERHATQDLSLEDWLVTAGDRILDVIQDIAAREGTYKTTYISEDTREEIDWKEVKIARDRYTLVPQAANGLSRTLAGRRAEVEEDYSSGIIDKDEYRKLRGLPDVNAERALEGAVTSLADSVIAGLIRNRPFNEIAPDPMDDLEFILRRVKMKRADLKAHKAPLDMLERFDQWIEQAEYLTGLAAAPAAPGAGMPPPEAMAGTQPGPEMVSNAPPAAQMPMGGAPMPPMPGA